MLLYKGSFEQTFCFFPTNMGVPHKALQGGVLAKSHKKEPLQSTWGLHAAPTVRELSKPPQGGFAHIEGASQCPYTEEALQSP